MNDRKGQSVEEERAVKSKTGSRAGGAALAHGGPLPERASWHLADLLWKAAAGDGAVVHVHPDGREHARSYGELLTDARRVLGGLRALGLRPQDRVLLQLARSEDFLAGFWACVLGGFVAVPLAPAPSYRERGAAVQRLQGAWEQLECALVVCGAESFEGVRELPPRPGAPPMTAASIEALRRAAPAARGEPADPDALALMPLTSGSTGAAKAVMLSGRNVVSMVAGTAAAMRLGASEVMLNWMPLDHVGALICQSTMAMELGCPQVLAPTAYVLEQPLRWLDLIARHRATVSWVPNFAYSLINERAAEVERGRWDLSSARVLINAGEAVVARTARSFLRMLAPHGLREDSIWPAFGMSETCSGISFSDGFSLGRSRDDDAFVDLGAPIAGASMRVVDHEGAALEEGQVGRLQVRGPSVTRGYFRQEAHNREAFDAEGWFTTGDLALLRGGRLTLTGREKDTIIIRGVNHHGHEIESLVEELPEVTATHTAACAVRRGDRDTDALAVFFHTPPCAPGELVARVRAVRRHVQARANVHPDHVIPIEPHDLPRTGIGKIQRTELRRRFERGDFDEVLRRLAEAEAEAQVEPAAPRSSLESQVAAVWERVLGVARVGLDDNFFELGGHSVLLVQLHAQMQEALGAQLSLVELFQYPTVRALAERLARGPREASPEAGPRSPRRASQEDGDVAVIGMACRFPGADDPESFWRNLREGVESITEFTEAEVLAAGVPPELARDPSYVRAGPVLRDVEGFDADFFGVPAREAALMDPQHRLFLECCYEAFEDAGHDPRRYAGAVGVYAGAGMNTYFINHVHRAGAPLTLDSMGGFQVMITNDKDYLPTRVSYKLDLRGPSVNVQTACSTTLVTIHVACRALLSGECDMALAGGVSVKVPQRTGHLHQDGLLVSPDGHCRAFDAGARGTIFGNGAGAVLLKRKADALADGDRIYAVIKGTAINNDGGRKLGYTAPGEASQAAVVREAMAAAGVSADAIGYVEAHGTGTELGDPIEVSALSQAFRASTSRTGFCALGSVKTNVGHLQIASGVAGFIKAALALHHRQIPASLHFERPNPRIDFERGPFFVNTALRDWPSGGAPRRAGVHSLGIGGTNAHAILEEAPASATPRNPAERTHHLFVLSARTEAALRASALRHAEHLSRHPGLPLGDVCFTASNGRAHFEHRLGLVVRDRASLREALAAFGRREPTPHDVAAGSLAARSRPRVAFVFTGQGAQRAGMARALYEAQPTFRAELERCAALLDPTLPRPLLEVLYGDADEATLEATGYAQPALFAVEYALAALWRSWGVEPDVVLGHSVGELAAAVAGGLLSLEDGCRLVAARGRLMQALPPGGEMAVAHAPAARVAPSLDPGVSIASRNGPDSTALSGPAPALRATLARLRREGVEATALRVSHAFHSELVEPMLPDLERAAAGLDFHAPRVPIISTLTGARADGAMATARYWARQAREPVAFEDAIRALQREGVDCVLELGPAPVLIGLARRCLPEAPIDWLPSLRPPRDDWRSMLDALAALYVRGASIDWAAFERDYRRQRVGLPTYPWQRERHWIDPAPVAPRAPHAAPRPLLGERLETAVARPEITFEARLGDEGSSYLREHRVFDEGVVPAAAWIEMALCAGRALLGSERLVLEGVTFHRALRVPDDGAATVQTVLRARGAGEYGFEMHARSPGTADASWTLHASGRLRPGDAEPAFEDGLEVLKGRCAQALPADEVYRALRATGLAYGPAFRALEGLSLGDGEALGRARIPDGAPRDEARDVLHPALLDGCLQVFAAASGLARGEGLHLPFTVDRLEVFRRTSGPLWSHATVAQGGERMTLRLYDDGGAPVARLVGTARPARPQEARAPGDPGALPLHAPSWRELPPLGPAQAGRGRWLLVSHAALPPLGEALAERLRARDIPAEVCALAALPERLSRGPLAEGAIYFAGPWAGLTTPEAARQHALAGLSFAQALGAHAGLARVLWVTERAQPVRPAEDVAPEAAVLWGLGRTFAAENPGVSTALVDAGGAPEQAEALLREALGRDTEGAIGLRDGRRYGLRLERAETATVRRARVDGAVLITGGAGALGLHLAVHLARAWGARHLVLVGRSAPDARAETSLAALRREGVRVDAVRADVTDRDALASLLAGLDAPLRGVVHAAGALDDGVLAHQSPARFDTVLAPKVLGAWHLHELTLHEPVEFFVLLSSAASLLGSAGQGNYAAANAFLDALVHHRRSRGLPASSVNYGPWADGGMAARLDVASRARLGRAGLRFLTTGTALAGFDQAVARGGQLGVFALEPERPRVEPGGAAWREGLSRLPPSELERSVQEWVRAEAARALGLSSAGALPPDRPLRDLGMDSLMAIELRNALASRSGHALPATLVFDHPDVRALGRHLAGLLSPGQRDDARPTSTEDVDAMTEEELDVLLAELSE